MAELPMAPPKEPASLYQLAFGTYTSLIYDSCRRIENQCGSYGSEDSIRAVQDLRSLLLLSIPAALWNDVFDKVLAFSCPAYKSPTLKMVYTIFACDKLTCIKLASDFRDDPNCPLQMGKPFWDNIFLKLNNVTEIEFCNNTVEEWVFDIISKHCPNLEKIFSHSNKFSLKALTFLTKCRKLRSIRGVKYCRFRNEELKAILESLPELECFDNPHLASCFADLEDGALLKLAELIVGKSVATPTHIASVARMCPNLKQLEIIPASREFCSTILDILSESTINLSTLTVWTYFPSGDRCRQFFSVKGIHLLSLKLEDCENNISFDLIKVIGEYCVNLRSLDVVVEGYVELEPSSACDTLMDRPVLKNLTTLVLEDWNEQQVWDDRIVEMCLSYATKLEKISLINVIHGKVTLERFSGLFAAETISELVDLRLSYPLSKDMIHHLYRSCPKLRKLILFNVLSNEAYQYLEQLKKYEYNMEIIF